MTVYTVRGGTITLNGTRHIAHCQLDEEVGNFATYDAAVHWLNMSADIKDGLDRQEYLRSLKDD